MGKWSLSQLNSKFIHHLPRSEPHGAIIVLGAKGYAVEYSRASNPKLCADNLNWRSSRRRRTWHRIQSVALVSPDFVELVYRRVFPRGAGLDWLLSELALVRRVHSDSGSRTGFGAGLPSLFCLFFHASCLGGLASWPSFVALFGIMIMGRDLGIR